MPARAHASRKPNAEFGHIRGRVHFKQATLKARGLGAETIGLGSEDQGSRRQSDSRVYHKFANCWGLAGFRILAAEDSGFY